MAAEHSDEILIDLVERAVRAEADRHPGRIDNSQRYEPWFTVNQERLLLEACRARGFVGDKFERKFRTVVQQYVLRATMAMVAYDLGKEFLEIFTGDPLPDEPLRSVLVDKSVERWGQWGIQGLGDFTEVPDEAR